MNTLSTIPATTNDSTQNSCKTNGRKTTIMYVWTPALRPLYLPTQKKTTTARTKRVLTILPTNRIRPSHPSQSRHPMKKNYTHYMIKFISRPSTKKNHYKKQQIKSTKTQNPQKHMFAREQEVHVHSDRISVLCRRLVPTGTGSAQWTRRICRWWIKIVLEATDEQHSSPPLLDDDALYNVLPPPRRGGRTFIYLQWNKIKFFIDLRVRCRRKAASE